MPFTFSYEEKIHYEIEGDGPPLVLQHGGFGSIEDWYEYGYVAGLKQHFRLVLIDARAYGESGKPHDKKKYSPEIHARDIVSVLDDLNISKCHYLGFSLGGRIGYWVARFHPQRLLSLIVLGMDPYPWDMDRMNQLIEATETLDDWVPTDANLSDSHKARWLKNDKQALAASMSYPLPDDSQVLKFLDIPCLVLCGDQDGSFEDAKRNASERQHTTFIKLDGFGHADTLFRSEIIIPHISEFLSSIQES